MDRVSVLIIGWGWVTSILYAYLCFQTQTNTDRDVDIKRSEEEAPLLRTYAMFLWNLNAGDGRMDGSRHVWMVNG